MASEPLKLGEDQLDADILLRAYALGVFPMALDGGEIGWFSPDPRAIIPLDAFHIPHGLKRALKKEPFTVRMDTAFREVMLGCAEREETWINEEIVRSYVELFNRGHAHSVECWKDDKLVGGLYGVSLGGAFFGESMFSRVTDASKVALVALVGQLRKQGFGILDTQWTTPHLRGFGAMEIPREEYLERLEEAIVLDVDFCDGDQTIA